MISDSDGPIPPAPERFQKAHHLHSPNKFSASYASLAPPASKAIIALDLTVSSKHYFVTKKRLAGSNGRVSVPLKSDCSSIVVLPYTANRELSAWQIRTNPQ
jgi:hypothetical protein